MKFDHIAHDNQSTSTKKVSCFIWKKKKDETNWSSDFYLH